MEILLDYKDITGIFKNNLKIDNMVKSISSIFLNSRFNDRIDYAPYFQRHYVWDKEKATYFIESILLGTEIPPLVFFDNGKRNEVIDGRQRYETILKFINNDLVLEEKGLKSLMSFAGKRYCDIDEDIREEFEETKLRILQCSVVNEPMLDEQKEDKIKKEIFRRYNSGIIPLKKEEIQRAEFINDKITQVFKNWINTNDKIFDLICSLFLPKNQGKKQKRDKINLILSKIRTLITLPLIPIVNYANSSSKSEDIGIYYKTKVSKIDEKILITELESIMKILENLKSIISIKGAELADNILLYECCYWIFTIILRDYKYIFESFDLASFSNYLTNAKNDPNIFSSTGSHYHKAIKNRYEFVAKYFIENYNLNLDKYFRNSVEFTSTLNAKEQQTYEIKQYKLKKPEPTSMTIEDICEKIKKTRFLIRPEYQRSEVTNPLKSSYLLESIMLGMKIPPIFVYKRPDKIYEVIDGQQRLLSIIGFLGKEYLNENGQKEISKKHKFKLKKLKILDNLNDKNVDTIDINYVNKILDFQLDVVEIDADQNPTFDNIDLFLRLNTKPYPIGSNTFEMWNSYVNKEVILKIRTLTDKYSKGNILFRLDKDRDTRMNNEELITMLAYLDYKERVLKSNIEDILDVYVRLGRINARIKKKDDITRVLDDVSKNNIQPFIDSVQNVEHFITKIGILANNTFDLLNKIFDHKYLRSTSRTNQNFYILWMILKKISLEELRIHREKFYQKISDLYVLIQNYPSNKSIDYLYKMIADITG